MKAKAAILFLLIPFAAAAASEPIGLVLSGGGAKGAYEVGVWKALVEQGLSSRIRAISGTSVGAVNAAIFATVSDAEAAERLWLENMKDVFAINTNRVSSAIQGTLDMASNSMEVARNSGDTRKGVVNFFVTMGLNLAGECFDSMGTSNAREGFLDSEKLAESLESCLSKKWEPDCPSVYATALEKGVDSKAKTWCLNPESHERRILMIRASAAIPEAFDTVQIDGKNYIDGSIENKGGDNVPILPILEHHPKIKTVVVVYLNDMRNMDNTRRDRVRNAAFAKGVRLVEIIPSQNIGGFFWGYKGVFDNRLKTVENLMSLGYNDAKKALEGL